MKKLILTITTILLFLTTSLISTTAFSFFKKSKQPTLEDVKQIYFDIFKNYDFDEKLGEQAQSICGKGTIADTYNCDVKFIEENKGGICRQFSHLLINKLKQIGVKATTIITAKPSMSHVSVVYELNGKKYVADPVRDKIYSKTLNTNSLLLFNIPFQNYIDLIKDDSTIFYYTLKDSPENIHKSFDALNSKDDVDLKFLS